MPQNIAFVWHYMQRSRLLSMRSLTQWAGIVWFLSGVKAEHIEPPLVSKDKILLIENVYPLCNTQRPVMVRLHGEYMLWPVCALTLFGIICSIWSVNNTALIDRYFQTYCSINNQINLEGLECFHKDTEIWAFDYITELALVQWCWCLWWYKSVVCCLFILFWVFNTTVFDTEYKFIRVYNCSFADGDCVDDTQQCRHHYCSIHEVNVKGIQIVSSKALVTGTVQKKVTFADCIWKCIWRW